MKHIFILFLYVFSCAFGISAMAATSCTFASFLSGPRTLPNDPPTGADKTASMLEDVAFTFAVSDFGFNDPLDEPQNAFMAVKITTLPANGTIKLSNINVTTGQFITVSNINSGNLKYFPLLNANGSPAASFTFQVQDDGGVANGGIDLDQSPNTFTFNITSVNDAPTFLIGPNQLVCKNSPAQSVGNWCTLISDGDPEVAQTVTFVVTNNMNALFSVQPAVSSTGTLTFTPAANVSGTVTVSVKLTDNGGTTNGGVNESPIQTAQIIIKPENGWVGKLSTDWFTAGNWCATVPTATSNVIIYPASFQPVIAGANATCSHITLMPSTTLNIVAPQRLEVTGD